MKKSLMALGISTAALALLTGVASAASNPNGTGQPNQSCEEQANEPVGFSTDGFAHAQTVYAGAQQQNSKNAKSVSQYDVACFQVSQ